MAGSIIAMPANGDSDWSSFVTIVEKTIRGYIGLDVSGIDTGSAPILRDGSVIEVNGAVFQFTTAESITGWPSAGGTTLYMTIVPAGTTCTATFTASAPTWTGTKNGWYDGNDRYFGELTWGGSATYTDKIIYQRFNDNNDNVHIVGDGSIDAGSGHVTATGGLQSTGAGAFLKWKTISMGEWNMDATSSKVLNHDLTWANIRGLSATIRNDAGSQWYIIPSNTDAGGTIDIWLQSSSTQVSAVRGSSGSYDAAAFDGTASTVPTRGYFLIAYV